MRLPASPLLAPLSLAGYLAWGAVAWELLFTRWAPVWGVAPDWALAGLLALFLGLFMAVLSDRVTEATARVLVLLQIALVFGLMGVARSSSLPILLILCAVQIVHLWSPRGSLLVLLAVNAGVYLVYRGAWQHGAPLLATMMYLSFQAFAALTAGYARNAERARDALAEANAELLATRSLLADSARDGERLRLARELHDVAGHKLTALKLNLAMLARQPGHADDERAQLCAGLVDELLADIRALVARIRHDDGLDLGSALAALVAPFPRPRTHLQVEPDARAATLAQAEAVLRAVQEGLTNAARHSQAQHLWVVLRREGDQLQLDIRDDGRGSGELRPGNGLTGMRERLEAVGGGLDARRLPTGGVRLHAWLPVVTP